MSTHTKLPDPATDVPSDQEPIATCPHCERPFRSVHARDLHVGELHEDAATDTERERYERALETERDDLWFFHAKAVVALGVTYSTTVILYMVVLGGFL
ncbi:MAG: DNA-binding protein [Haloarculaceae archaeon]